MMMLPPIHASDTWYIIEFKRVRFEGAPNPDALYVTADEALGQIVDRDHSYGKSGEYHHGVAVTSNRALVKFVRYRGRSKRHG